MEWTPPKFRLDCTVAAAAYFVSLAGGTCDKFQLLKLLYLLDRGALEKWGYPVTYDRYERRQHGPVLGETYSLMQGSIMDDRWTAHFSVEGNSVKLVTGDPNFGPLPKSEMELIEELYKKHKDRNFAELRSFVHDLPEWKSPRLPSTVITLEDILHVVVKDPKEKEMIIDELKYESAKEELLCL